MRLIRARRPVAEVDVVVVGSGLPPLLTALELAGRGTRVRLVAAAPGPAPAHGLGLALLGTGRPYVSVARAIGRAAAQLLWAAGCENHLRLKAFLEQAGRPCGYLARGSFLLARSRGDAEELAESEDMLREDGFPGEFLDHYMLETRFDLAAFRAGYWAAEDAELDPEALLAAALAAVRASPVSIAGAPARALRADASGVVVELERGSVPAAAAVVASDGPVRGLVPALATQLAPRTVAQARLAPLAGARLPGAMRTADAAWAAQLSEDGADLDLAATGAPATPVGHEAEAAQGESGVGEPGGSDSLRELAALLPVDAARARLAEDSLELAHDGLPLVGRLPGVPLAVACGFGRLAPGLAFAAARWVADALLRGADPTPVALRATRARVV